MPTKWTPENLSDARRLYEEGRSFAEVARMVGIDAETLRLAFHRVGFKIRPRGVGKQRRGDQVYRVLYDRYLAGESGVVLAREAGINFANLYTAWRKRGWPVRDGQEAARLRFARMTDAEKCALTFNAHTAASGRTVPLESKLRAALTRERLQSHATERERWFAELLNESGFDPTLQRAIGPYNCDIAIDTIAVEIFGGGWHGGGRAYTRWPQRARYMLDCGWSVIAIWAEQHRQPLEVGAAEYVIAFAEAARRDPPTTAQYRVVRGNGEEIVAGCADDDYFPIKPARGTGEHVRCKHQRLTD